MTLLTRESEGEMPEWSRHDGGRGRPLLPLEQMIGPVAAKVRDASIALWGDSKAVEIVGRSPKIIELQKKIEKIAPFQEPVLITGESGVGKESLAQAIYLLGPRRGKAMVSINCPQYREGNLTVSELFGHRKGSFTGATSDRQGCFETANGGVIFLDEIGDLHMSAQVMLLRALAKGEFQPLGADYTRTVNVRVVAATNRPLNKLMIGEEFRHDLFFRLQYFLLAVPPLRDRGDDWAMLLEYYLAKLAHRYAISKRFSAASLRLLESYPWPGNVRELISVTTTGYALCDGQTIEPRDFNHLMSEPGDDSGQGPRALYDRLVIRGETFWGSVYGPFMERDLSRQQVRELIRLGLTETQGSYRKLLELFRMDAGDYQKFMDFLRHHQLKP
jgi:DNA-binding NtrC family response regulator